ncbi:unnamed protein product [Zymoseptoria tritici ST99CH_3D7]|uniref:Uncharacterized protein n=1 Tax=Zymoseptoria tritici (strain ST99CH_3D7) TaxID=1276538 RepID=A0A1X7S9Z3_ZYMT9|nr:unnamed protein product [Zymoseptoria tritici ST99CH_3D7]
MSPPTAECSASKTTTTTTTTTRTTARAKITQLWLASKAEIKLAFQALTRVELRWLILCLTIVSLVLLAGTLSSFSSSSPYWTKKSASPVQSRSPPPTTTSTTGSENRGACAGDSGGVAVCPMPDVGYLNW